MAEEHLAAEARPRRNLTAIRQGAERARDLVDQILTFVRRREGRWQHVCIKMLVAEAKSLLAPSLPAHVEIAVSETAETAVVSAEPAQLQQVILNICNNAAQAMDKPGVIRIEIGTCEVSDAKRVTQLRLNLGRFVVVSISDPGRVWTKRHWRGSSSRSLRRVMTETALGLRLRATSYGNITALCR